MNWQHKKRLASWGRNAIARVTLPMAQPSGVEGRLRAVLRDACRREHISRHTTVTSGLIVLVCVVLLAAVRPASLGEVNSALHSRPAHITAQTLAPGLFDVDGVHIRAEVYRNRNGTYRCAYLITHIPPHSDHWALDEPDPSPGPIAYTGPPKDFEWPYQWEGSPGIVAGFPLSSDIHEHTAVLHLCLHRYDTYDERVPLADLPVARSKYYNYLAIRQPRSIVTQSGVTISLPVQNVHTEKVIHFTKAAMTNPATLIFVNLTPSESPVVLPRSPLYLRHHLPVAVTLLPGSLTTLSVDHWYPVGHSPGLCKTYLVDELGNLLDSRRIAVTVFQAVRIQDIPFEVTVPIARNLSHAFSPSLGPAHTLLHTVVRRQQA